MSNEFKHIIPNAGNDDNPLAEKTEKLFSEDQINHLSKKFKILSEPSRLKILSSLFGGEKCVTEIIEHTGLMQANVSKQLRTLHDSGILASRSEGLQRYYRVIDFTILQICNVLCKEIVKS